MKGQERSKLNNQVWHSQFSPTVHINKRNIYFLPAFSQEIFIPIKLYNGKYLSITLSLICYAIK